MTLTLRSLIRRALPALWLWLPLGLLSTLLFYERDLPNGGSASTSFSLVGGHSAITPLIGILAAALGERLFAGGLGDPSTPYWRCLPVAPIRRFQTRFAIGLGALGVAFAIYALWFATGIQHAVQLLWIGEGVRNSTPDTTEWLRAALWAVVTFSATSWFASTMDRAGSAAQAGTPGFVSGILLASTNGQTLFGIAPHGTGVTLAILIAVAAAASAWPHRAAIANRPTEPVRRRPTGVDSWLTAAATLVLVVLPAVVVFAMLDAVWPFFGVSPAIGRMLLLVPVGIAFLPRTIAQLRRLRLPGRSTLAIGFASLTGVGALLWNALRPRTPDRRRPLLVAPRVQLFTALVAIVLMPLALGGLRFARAWTIHVPDDVEVVLGDDVLGHGTHRGITWGPQVGPSHGMSQTAYSSVYSLPLASTEGWSIETLDLKTRDSELEGRLPHLTDAFPPDRRLRLRRGGKILQTGQLRVGRAYAPFRAVLEIEVVGLD